MADIIQDGKRATLAAAARGGSAGVQAYKDAKATMDEQQANALKAAQQRASLIGGPEAQGFESIAGQVYNRGQSNLASSQANYIANRDLHNQANASYFDKVRSSVPLVEAQTKKLLALYEAEKKSAAEKKAKNDFPLESIVGQVELSMPQAKKDAEAAKATLDAAKAKAQPWETGAYSKDTVDRMNRNIARLNEINELTAGKGRSGLKVLKSVLPGGEKALWNDKAVKDLKNEQATLLAENQRLQGQLDSTRANEKRHAGEYQAEVAKAQAEYDRRNNLTTHTGLARDIAGRMGIDPVTAAGNLNEKTLNPYANATESNVTKALGEQATGLAQKLDIKGGPARVAEILSQVDVTANLQKAQEWAMEGKTTLNEAKRKIGEAYLTPGEDYDPDGYKVVLELMSGLPWKREKN